MLVSEWENSPNRQIHQRPSILLHPIKKPKGSCECQCLFETEQEDKCFVIPGRRIFRHSRESGNPVLFAFCHWSHVAFAELPSTRE